MDYSLEIRISKGIEAIIVAEIGEERFNNPTYADEEDALEALDAIKSIINRLQCKTSQ